MSKIDGIIDGMQAAELPSDYWINSNIKFPELEASRTIMQRNNQSVWEHTMLVINHLVIKNPITLLASLFHDLGKCHVVSPIKNIGDLSLYQFPRHSIESCYIAKRRLTQWETTPYIMDRILRIIKTHMYDIVDIVGEKTIRKFIAEVGLDNLENWFAVRRADSASYSHYGQYKRHIIDPFYNNVMKYLDELPQESNPAQLQSDPNIDISGKECKSNDTFLSMEGV